MLGSNCTKFISICLAVEIEVLQAECNGSVLEVKWNSTIFENIAPAPGLKIQVCFVDDIKCRSES